MREAIEAANAFTGEDVITFDQTALQAEAGAGNPLTIRLGGTQLDITDDEFRVRFRRTPLWRCHPAGMRANALVVKENLERG